MKLVISNKEGRIFIHPHMEPAGMEAGHFFGLDRSELVKLPKTSRLFMLPGRRAVGYEPITKSMMPLDGLFAVSAFVPPGYTTTYNSAYTEKTSNRSLPLFSYAAVAYFNGALYAASLKVDSDRRHDSQLIDMDKVRKNVSMFKKILKGNRLLFHLEDCALKHGCPNAQNFFLKRFEAPLPTSPSCNAACAGCISYQKGKAICAAQPRIKFVPSPEEVSEIALFHIDNAKDPIVSFGQGCEGEPLLSGKTIERAVRLIRDKTCNGTININTNASLPQTLSRLFDAGIDSVRISLNSAQKKYYDRYYKPKGYGFKDVKDSIRAANKSGIHTSLNYLTMPGFTDWREEHAALKRLLYEHNIDMIQWRNLNFDPMEYFRLLNVRIAEGEIIGIKESIKRLSKKFPRLRMGYFNPAVRTGRG